MLVVIIDVYLATNMALDVNFYTEQKTVPELVELPSSNLCVTSIGAAIFILMLNHAGVIGDQSDAVTQNAWFRCELGAAVSGEISILIQTVAESQGRFAVPRICRWESKTDGAKIKEEPILHRNNGTRYTEDCQL